MKSFRPLSVLIVGLAALLAFPGLPALAKKKKADVAPAPVVDPKNPGLGDRLSHLSGDDQRRFDDLSPEQKTMIRAGQIGKGFNAWMVKLSLGEPYYDTEHSPVFTDYEEVWLYTKQDVQNDVQEERIADPQNNGWPTIHRTTHKKTCIIGDFFVLWDRGVVQDIKPDDSHKIYGSCRIANTEAFLPIVNGKPVEPKQAPQ